MGRAQMRKRPAARINRPSARLPYFGTPPAGALVGRRSGACTQHGAHDAKSTVTPSHRPHGMQISSGVRARRIYCFPARNAQRRVVLLTSIGADYTKELARRAQRARCPAMSVRVARAPAAPPCGAGFAVRRDPIVVTRRSLTRCRARAGKLSSSSPRVVCIGEALFDCLADQVGAPREKVESWTPYPGGAPLNVATACTQLGVPAALVTCIGSDALGDELVRLMEKRGVDTSGVQRSPQPTRDVLVVRHSNGDRVFAGFGSPTAEYADCYIEADRIPRGLVEEAEVTVVGTLGLAQPTTREGVTAAVEAAKAAGKLVVVDVNWRPVFWEDPSAAVPTILPLLRRADIVKMTDEEAEWLLDISPQRALDDPAHVERTLREAGAEEVKGVLVTAGDKGAAFGFGGVAGFQPVFEVHVVDTTGAGDAFTAGFVSRLVLAGGVAALSPKVLRRAVAFGAACGALTTTRAGAIDSQPSMDEVEQLLGAAGVV